MECIHTNRKLSEERSPLISWYYWNQMLHINVHHLVVLRHKLWMKSLFSPGGRSRKPHKCYYMSRLIKYDWNLFTFRFGAAYFFILNLPKDFWTSYRIPAENIFLNIRMLIAMLLIFHHFQISIIFMNECSFQNVNFQACHGQRRFAIASVSINRQSQLLWPFRQARNLSEKPEKLRLDQAFGALVKTEVLSSHPVVKRDIQSCR